MAGGEFRVKFGLTSWSGSVAHVDALRYTRDSSPRGFAAPVENRVLPKARASEWRRLDEPKIGQLLQFSDFLFHCGEQWGGQLGVAFLCGEVLAIAVHPVQ